MSNSIPEGRALDWELLQILWPDLSVTNKDGEFWYKGNDTTSKIDFRPSTCDPNAIWSLLEYIREQNLEAKFKVLLKQEALKDDIELKDELDYMRHHGSGFVVRAAYQVIKRNVVNPNDLTENEAAALHRLIFKDDYKCPNTEEKMDICKELFESQKIVSGFKESGNGYQVSTGIITQEPERGSGVWGYGGDSIAIYIDGEPYPSWTVVSCEKHLEQLRNNSLFSSS